METQVRTPQMVFMQPQRLVVPLFQRPYVWNEENQWEPLWNDITRTADRVLDRPHDKHTPHFLGAVVLQQTQQKTGQMQERTIIDGQQRLTTLQILLDALHAELLFVQAAAPAMRIEPLITNALPFCSKPEDRFKVWPTNRDRLAFNTVMGAEPPINYDTLGHKGERMVEAHRYFSERAREWLSLEGTDESATRAATIETVVRELLQMVVIDLTVDENAQEIFETLNARGAQLTAADLIKNFIFQKLLEDGANYNQVVAELVSLLLQSDRNKAGDIIEKFFASQSSGSRYWPDDDEVREELSSLLVYRRLGRGRLRMVLEAVEDHKRGWRGPHQGLGGERVARGKYAIEHIMPRKWLAHWPLPQNIDENERDRLIHTLGNLTLLTGKLNSKVSNGPWLGEDGKRSGLEKHDVLLLNRELLKSAGNEWTDQTLRERTQELANTITQIWPVPPNHKSGFTTDRPVKRKKIQLPDLINGGFLTPGMPLFPRKGKYNDKVATLLPEGQIEINGTVFDSPSPAASHITGKPTNGWWFFLTDQSAKTSLRSIRRSYIDNMAVDAEEDDDTDDDEDDEP